MKKGMTGFQLKVLGIITMVFDHLSEFFSFAGIPGWFNWIGRITAPIFLFESSEGFIHTRNRKRYMFRLLAGYWIMGIITTILSKYFAIGNSVIINNIFGTIFLGTVFMQACEYLKQRKTVLKGLAWLIVPLILSIIPMLLLTNPAVLGSTSGMWFFRIYTFLIPTLLLTEGGFLFVLLAVLFYLFHGKKYLQVAALVVIALISLVVGSGGVASAFTTNYQWMMLFAAIPIILYNGEKGRGMRNFFYIFYPAHITVFAIISFLMQR
ncbi:TraX family protein [Enterococcus sp. 22-H-5-01]|uniref:TraX family protein n=1 Tax=Enterococcus sp. 22-H-5-01 TaxID=3418555 RepID=UPI003D035816